MLFLNNAINHGVLGPLGVDEALHKGKSIMFMIETNPGPGLGILLAYWFFGPQGAAPVALPAAIIIHFLGGIHEIYFPYVLMKPRLILAAIAGGMPRASRSSASPMSGSVATPSPGSIFAYISQTPEGRLLRVLLGIAVSAGVSLAVAGGAARFRTQRSTIADDLDAAQEQSAPEQGRVEARRPQWASDDAQRRWL